MTEPDRTTELVRAMLDRRASGPVPPGLLDRTMHEVVLARRHGTTRRRERSARALAVLALVAAVAAVAVYGLLGGAVPPGSAEPGAAGLPSTIPASAQPASAGASTNAAPASAGPVTSSAPGSSPGPAVLRPGMTAIVTAAGNGLRVRTAPGVGQDYTKLSPLLRAGTRMQVLLGPVEADGYDWYEISTDAQPGFGWVAAGKDGVAWIVAVAP